jgi:hypothetical protein
MRHILLASLVAACGATAPSSDPGTGTKTLLVTGHVDAEDGNATVSIHVERAGSPLATAAVTMSSELNAQTTLSSQGGGDYGATLPGWAESYHLVVSADADHLDGTIAAAANAPVLAPAPTVAFDPHNAPQGVVTVAWGGAAADTVHIKTKDFDYGPQAEPAASELAIAATVFTDTAQDIEIDRANSVDLAGGIAGSNLTSSNQTKTTVLVANPYPKP